MTKTGKILSLVGAGVAWLVYRTYTSYKRLKYRFSNVRFIGASGTNVTLGVDFELYNPTAVSLRIGTFRANLFLQGVVVGHVAYNCNTVMMSNAISVFPLSVTIDTAKVTETAWNLLAVSTLQQWTITIDGELQVEGYNIPVSFDYPLSKLNS